ncbi:MAG: CPBP family intramembrane metalloprotease [Myxococcales bacterium]|nr:CPBP family intramembrane metalloprotease [Myxococcales bacterium]
MTRRRARVGWAGHGELSTSLALVFPLVLAYGIGVAMTLRVNAVDGASRGLWWACGHDRGRYLLAYAALALGYLWWLRRHRRADVVRVAVIAPVVVEAAIYACTLATVVWFVVAHLPGLGADTVIGAIGAGVHEELVFRLIGVAGCAALARRAGLRPQVALAAAAVISALVFAAAHHLGGEPWAARAFVFRAVAGLGFTAVFWWRSLAHAVYAHVLYDLWVAAS